MYKILSVVIPGDPILNVIYMKVEGIVNDFVADIWLVFGIEVKVANEIDVAVEI